MRCLSLVMSECFLSGRGQGHVSNFYIVDLENFATASRRYRWYSQLDRSRFVYDTHNTMEATRSRHGWVHMFITHRPTLTLQLHNFDLFRTCRTTIFCTVASNWQDFNWHDASRDPSAIAELLVVFSQICAPIHNEDFRAKNRHIHSSGRVYGHESLGSNDSGRLYDERPVGRSSYSRRESFERRFSCDETVCRPHLTDSTSVS